ncbi:MAG: hypothetical protein AB1640_22800 [bacterium]
MKAAFAVWQDRISPVFDVSKSLIVIEVENGRIVARTQEVIESDDPVVKVRNLVERGIQVLVCGAVSRPLADLAALQGVGMISFTSGQAEDVIRAFVSGALPNAEMSMPGCCGSRTRLRGACVSRGDPNLSSGPVPETVFKTGKDMTMPRGDGKGPQGRGPGTGKGFGGCRKQDQDPAGSQTGGGRGSGCGRGRGKGGASGQLGKGGGSGGRPGGT